MIKTKILKVLPYWLTFLGLAMLLQMGALFLPAKNKPQNPPVAQAAAAPQVLGESTSLRGDELAPTLLEKISEPDLTAVIAKSFLAFDLNDGKELAAKNPDDKLGIASLTKLMTGLVAYKRSDLNQTFKISAKDRLNVEPDLGLYVGDDVKALDIFNAMLIGSNNDAALALSDYAASTTDSDFVGMMNDEAKQLDMNNSNFSNPIGFDSQYNYSTAHDLKILITETEKLSAFTGLGRKESYEFTGSLGKTYSTQATNKLIKNHPDISAIKTGYTDYSAGAMATKIKISGHDIVILVLGSKDREGDTLKLKDALESSFK